MYTVNIKKNKYKLVDKEELRDITGFPMASKNKVFNIADTKITHILITNQNLAHPLVMKKVSKKYQKLINFVTELLVDGDDDSGDGYREALNQIERFRVEIKGRYREFLKQKELEKMSKQLQALKKETTLRLYSLNSYFNTYENGKSK